MKLDTSVALIGAGKLGESLVRGLIDAGTVDAARVTVTAAHRSRPERLAQELGVHAGASNVGNTIEAAWISSHATTA